MMFPGSFDRFGSSQFTNVNINFNFGGANGAGGASDVLTDLLNFLNPGADTSNDIFGGSRFDGSKSGDIFQSPPIAEPVIEDNGGGLKTDGGKITTAGGYTIEATDKFEWKITGPDGKTTRVWGDPHVDEGDGGKFDFKRNSTFVLGDGTKINVSTVPYGNGATVTGKLEVISGNDRVEVTDVDKGKGKIGTVTQDGYAHANSFQGDVFVQGRETDDWSSNGKEIIGSDNQGETLKLGGELEAGGPRQNNGLDNTRGFDQMFNRFAMNLALRAIGNLFNTGFAPQNRLGSNPYAGNTLPSWQDKHAYNRNSHRSNLTNSFRDMSRMFDMLARFSRLNDRLDAMRQRSNIYA